MKASEERLKMVYEDTGDDTPRQRIVEIHVFQGVIKVDIGILTWAVARASRGELIAMDVEAPKWETKQRLFLRGE
jgi:hypothetical protein